MATIAEALASALEHHQAGRFQPAEQIYRQILAVDPRQVDALHFMGVLACQQGQPATAIDYMQRAIRLNGTEAAFHSNLGNAYKEVKQYDEAIDCYRRALELKPDLIEAHNNLGYVLREMGEIDEAIACFHRALALNPNYDVAYNNLGIALFQKGEFDNAVAAYRQALRFNPSSAETHNNMGNAVKALGKFDEAIALYHRAIGLLPSYEQAHANLALVWLLVGDWEKGWSKHDWRLRLKDVPQRVFTQPRWDGSSLAGKTILLHAEQGLGDTIQFIRFAPIVKKFGATVVVECQKPLLRLLASCGGVDQWVAQGSPLPAFDVHAPLMSVPGILKVSIDTVPADIPYIHPPQTLVDQWRERLSTLDGFRVGINWQGNPQYLYDRLRSMSLRHFAPLGQVPGVRLISLQKGAGTEQLTEIHNRFPVTVLPNDLDQQSGAFMDTAAVMKNLDLVITSCTATAHLAGAIGVPVWVALRLAPDWRWLLARSDTPWYPTMRLFRQQEPGNWERVFAEISEALRLRMKA